MKLSSISINSINALVFDFDGVLTNNLVHIDQDGKELVSCSRADGLAFDVLRKLKKSAYILSTETNAVVTSRAKKLKIPVLQGVSNKVNGIKQLAEQEGINLNNILYVGNDLNDYRVMQVCGLNACPSDSHDKVKGASTCILRTKGGNGVVRELLEDILHLNIIEILYSEKESK